MLDAALKTQLQGYLDHVKLPFEIIASLDGSSNSDEMRAYHDRDWGTPSKSDRRHFQFLVLESAQSGLSWAIVWRKRKREASEPVDHSHVTLHLTS